MGSDDKKYLDAIQSIGTKVDENTKCVLDLDKKIALGTQETKLKLHQLKEENKEQNQIFREHTALDTKTNEKHIEVLEKISDCVEKVDKRLDLHIQKTEYELKNISRTDEIQNQILKEHVAGVQTLKKMHESQKTEVGARLEKLEEPGKWRARAVKLLISAGAIAGALFAIVKWFM